MIIRNITILITIVLPLQFAGLFILSIVLLFYLKDKRCNSYKLESQRLPTLFKWWDVGDEYDTRYGINGDLPYQYNWDKKSKWSIYRMRYNWLALRNPVNYLKVRVLGQKITRVNGKLKMEQSPGGVTIGDWYSPGYVKRNYVESPDVNISEYYLIWVWPFKKDKCVRIRIGHKIGDGEVYRRRWISWVCVISPWKTFRGQV